MYLKSIEIQGFKSFAHKTLLNFNNGVTCIVGPNGSGKSNISDAVRWVLGEQKVRQLRGAAMQDVIFSGTELRKAQGFAFVSITLDNSDHALSVDYTEITVSRKLFRSGESDYMINGQSVRLRDVQELFYDTGIGREGYSIIGQGQIDAVINGRPQDRRGLFDEAAGIVKFKKRKTAASRRLDSVRENMTRLADIIGELERRLRPLERQSETARAYLKLRDEQKKLDLNLFIRQTASLLDSLEKTKNNLEIITASLAENEEENEKLRDSAAELMERIAGLEREIEEKKNEESRALLARENLGGQISVREAEIRSDRDNAARLDDSIEKLEKELAADSATALKYLEAADELAGSLELICRDLRENGADTADADELKAEIEGYRGRLAAMGIEGAADAGGQEPVPEEDEDGEISFVMPDWMKAIRNKKDDLAEIREKEERNREWLDKASDEYNRLTKELRDLENELGGIQNRRAAAGARLDSLKNIAERYEGYGESIRAVMREKNRLGGVRGVVADIIRTRQEYETAVETALGARMQNIVTDDENSAKSCIEYLKKTRQGRATFLPLDAIRFKAQQELERAVREPGAVGIASSITEADPEYDGLREYLLGNILVTDTIDSALKIAGKYRHTLRIVTLEGELLSPGGSISGGAFRNKSGLMGRSREIAELEQSLAGMRRQENAVRDRIGRQEKLVSEKSEEIDRLNAALKDIADKRNELSFGITSDMKLQFSELRTKTHFVGENIGRIAAEHAGRTDELEKAKAARTACDERIAEAESFISERQEDITHISSELEKLTKYIAEKNAEKDSVTGNRSGLAARREELSDTIRELEKDRLRLENQLEKEQQKLDDESAYIWDEYGLTRGGAQEHYDEEMGSVTSIRSRLGSVRKEIRDLGPVNVQAIEEYKEVSERYTFMKGQFEDLAASESSIQGIIDELDDGMKKQFEEQFAAIREQFGIVFRELFGGGETDLGLVYEQNEEGSTDELEAGISIMAQPPGKKLQNIMQLSGGEKALTAIALLFAIQNLKPSPFCLLDEIEAALDDSNVTRFADYLHKLTDRTQFIVITHRRGTMESADRLYGVTMQEKGITKLVSVDLVSDMLT